MIGSSSNYQPRPKMIFYLLLVSMAASCLGNLVEVPEYWEPVSPELHPIMKEFSKAVTNAHQNLVKQTSKTSDGSVCNLMKTTLTMVIQARHALDCGSDDLCLVKKLGYQVNASSLGHVCSALREVESG